MGDRENLAHVDVSENAMGPDGVEACRPAIEGKEGLRALFMCNNGLSEAAMETVRVRECSRDFFHRWGWVEGGGGVDGWVGGWWVGGWAVGWVDELIFG